ncbi:MAG TPA: PAS domain S-box protein [Planctomycetota bacterium]|jgi:PAS domain S-box-containing protein
MEKALRILHLEDSAADAELIQEALRADGLSFDVVTARNHAEFQAALKVPPYDLVLCDYNLPDVDGPAALEELRAQYVDVPFIVVSGAIGEERAVELLKSGATDYVLKDRLARLGTIVRRALEEARARAEQQRVEQALRDSEAKYRRLHESITDAFATSDMAGHLTEFNRAFQTMLGYSDAELRGLTYMDLTPSRWHDLETRLLHEQVLQRGYSDIYEKEYKHKDGTVFPVEVRTFLLRDEAGQPAGMWAIVRDITERKRAEEELRKREEWLSGVMRHTRCIMWSGLVVGRPGWEDDAEGRGNRFDWPDTVLDEQAAQQVLPLDVPPGKTYLQAWVASRDPNDYRAMLATSTAALRSGAGHYAQDFRCTDRYGKVHWMHEEVTLRPIADGRWQSYGVVTDITQRKVADEKLRESQERYRLIVETSSEGIFVMDAKEELIWVNQTLAQTLGYTAEEMLGHSLTSLVVKAGAETGQTRIRRRSKTDRYEWRLRHKDGSERWMIASMTPMLDKAGQFSGAFAMLTDITERKRAEEALRESEERYRLLADHTEDIVVLFDSESNRLYASPSFYRKSGWRADEVDSKQWRTRVHPEDLAEVERAHAENLAGKATKIEYRARNKDGSWQWLDTSCKPILGADGKVWRMLVWAHDITARKCADEALRESEERFQQLANNSDEVFWMSDVALGRMLYVSPAYERLWGRSRQSLYSNPQSFMDAVHPEDRERVRNIVLNQRNIGATAQMVYRIVRPDGSLRWVWDRAVPVRDKTGRIYRLAGVAADITERKKAEAEYELLMTAMDQAAEAVLITDAQGIIQYVNPAFEAITGYTRAEAIGQNPRILKSEKQDAELYRSLWSTISGGKSWQGRLINKKKDGSLYTEEANISPVRDATGAITNYVAVKRDVTREVSLEAQFIQVQKMEAIGRLAAGVAHDFNNLLTVILGRCEMLLEKAEEPRVRRDLDLIHSSSKRAAALTRQLLLFSRQESTQRKVIGLNDVVVNMEKLLRRAIGEDIDLITDLVPAPSFVNADAGQIEQVILNLAVNARDAMPKGGKLIIQTSLAELSADGALRPQGSQPGSHVVLAVMDTGCGMSPEVQAHIFEPFFTTKEVGKGTGLGLSTVYGIIHQHGGSIQIASQLGRGSTFKIYLPRCMDTLVAKSSGHRLPSVRGNGQTVLLVEDEELVRELLQERLAQFGYHVLPAENGEKALAAAAHHVGPIDLLLTDVVMPGMDGVEVATRLRQTRPDLKTLLVSGYSDGLLSRGGVLDERTQFLPKPLRTDLLSQKIAEMLGLA